MKIYMDKDEEYPVYGIGKTLANYYKELEIDEKTYKRWIRILKAYDKVQNEMQTAYERIT